MDINKEINELTETLKQQRDELKVKLHLFGMEAKDEWEKAEDNWDNFKNKSEHLASAGKEASKDVGAAVKLLGEELKNAYDRMRKSV